MVSIAKPQVAEPLAIVARPYVRVACLILLLFILRIASQLLQWLASVSWLPDFESWHSATLPYEALLFFQGLIVLGIGISIERLAKGQVLPRRAAGRWWLGVGGLYFTSMLVRLSVGLLDLSAHRWFHSPLPTLFHLVLASFLLTLGTFHYRESSAE